MTVAVPKTDSSDAVTGAHLLMVLPPEGQAGDPVSQEIEDVVRTVFTAALEGRLNNAPTTEGVLDAVGAALAALGEFTYDDMTDAYTFALSANSVTAAQARADTPAHAKEWRARLGLREPVAVVAGAINQNIAAGANGYTFVLTGGNARTFFLPPASGAGEVPNGWETVFVNRSTAELTGSPNGADRIDGNPSLAVDAGHAVRIQKIATGQWAVIADTETGEAGEAFAPSKSNLYDAVKAIFSHNPSVTPDDENDELDFSPGAAGAIPDDSILPVKARASTAAFRKEWRDRLEAAHLSVLSNTLPPVAGFSVGRDFVILGRSSADTRVAFRDSSDPSTELTESVAGDVFLLQNTGWTRVGNIIEGSPVLRARIAAIEAKTDRLTVFGQADLSPRGITGPIFPEFMALHLAGKIDPRPLAQIQVLIEGSPVATINTANLILPFNRDGSGIANLNLTQATRDNLATNLAGAAQYVTVYIRYKFEGTSLAGNVEPDEIDSIRFGVQNNSYRGSERRFEAGVGASPAILPRGTYKLHLLLNPAGEGRLVPVDVLISDLGAADKQFWGRADAGDERGVRMRYTAATRTLTWSLGGGSGTIDRFIAIGAI